MKRTTISFLRDVNKWRGYLAGILLKTAKKKTKATIMSFVFIQDLYLCEVFVIEHGQLGILRKHRGCRPQNLLTHYYYYYYYYYFILFLLLLLFFILREKNV